MTRKGSGSYSGRDAKGWNFHANILFAFPLLSIESVCTTHRWSSRTRATFARGWRSATARGSPASAQLTHPRGRPPPAALPEAPRAARRPPRGPPRPPPAAPPSTRTACAPRGGTTTPCAGPTSTPSWAPCRATRRSAARCRTPRRPSCRTIPPSWCGSQHRSNTYSPHRFMLLLLLALLLVNHSTYNVEPRSFVFTAVHLSFLTLSLTVPFSTPNPGAERLRPHAGVRPAQRHPGVRVPGDHGARAAAAAHRRGPLLWAQRVRPHGEFVRAHAAAPLPQPIPCGTGQPALSLPHSHALRCPLQPAQTIQTSAPRAPNPRPRLAHIISRSSAPEETG